MSGETRLPVAAPDSAAARFATEGFGLAHLPYCSYRVARRTSRLGIRLGGHVLDVTATLAQASVASSLVDACSTGNLDGLLRAGHPSWRQVRAELTAAVAAPGSAEALAPLLTPLIEVELGLPFSVGDYVDFYGNEFHASNVGHIFRPGQPPLTANWKHLPIGYHGRSGTIVPSGTDIPRPKGVRPEPDAPPSFGPSRRLDIEAEVGFVLGGSAPHGEVPITAADDHVFGLTLTNDWSARDIQAFEYVPLGPNLGKSFGTTISPWVTPLEALAAVRTAPPPRDTPLSPYLDDADAAPWAFDLDIEVVLNGETVSRPPFLRTYWTAAQMLAHMTVNGASLWPGDFFASGTISGPERLTRGSFLELSWGGEEPLILADGTPYTFLRDGDEVALRATTRGVDGSLIRFGDAVGRIVPAD